MTHKGFFGHFSFLRPGASVAVLAATILLTLLAGSGASAGDDPIQAGTPGFAPAQNGFSSVLLEQRGKNHESIADFLAPASRQIDAPPQSCLRLRVGISAPIRHTLLSSLLLYTQTTASDL